MQRLGFSRSTGHTVVEMSWKHEATHAETSRQVPSTTPWPVPLAVWSCGDLQTAADLWILKHHEISRNADIIRYPSQQMPFLAVDENLNIFEL